MKARRHLTLELGDRYQYIVIRSLSVIEESRWHAMHWIL